MPTYTRNCQDDRDTNDNRYAKKGLATTGVVLGGVALGLEVLHGIWDMVRSGRRSEAEAYCRRETAAANNGNAMGLEVILPLLTAWMASNGNQKNCEMTTADKLAQITAERYADGVGLGIYQNQVRAVAAAVGECQRQGMQKDIERLQSITELQSKELCEVQKNEAVNAERLKALAHAVKEGDERNREEFYSLLHRESDARKCWEKQADMRFEYEQERRILGDKESKAYADCNFVRNKKVLDASQICPDVVTEVEYLRGVANNCIRNYDGPVVPSNKVCCPPKNGTFCTGTDG